MNPYAVLVDAQETAVVKTFTLESGVELTDVPVAYRAWGKYRSMLDGRGNLMVICHALTGSANVADWYYRALILG